MENWPTNSTQQFCLRWHNHQASLLSTLPLLLDQSHLTDVTLSAEGRTVKAHRVVLSACSTFFLELFQTVEAPFHPVIVLPGASFGTMVALLTFMYSGEVNVYEEQISGLLSLAETLGIKGLADFNSNNSEASSNKCETPQPKENKDPMDLSPPILNPTKFSTSLEHLFAKTFPFCTTMMNNPLNFTQTAINRGAEILARYQNTCRLQNSTIEKNVKNCDENGNQKIENKKHKNIDKIAENLRSANNPGDLDRTSNVLTKSASSLSSGPVNLKQQNSSISPVHHFPDEEQSIKHSDQMMMLQQPQIPPHMTSIESNPEAFVDKPLPVKTATSKLYATCFICHKQLSNQYNLRVHLETHQNVRYACNVCSHVSRSKDALRKHVSYRHPGAQSLCDPDLRRKRSKLSHNLATGSVESHITSSSSSSEKPHPFMTLQQHLSSTINECLTVPTTTTSSAIGISTIDQSSTHDKDKSTKDTFTINQLSNDTTAMECSQK